MERMFKKILATICILALLLPICSEVIATTETDETKSFGISKTNEYGVGYKVTVLENGEYVEKQVYRTYVSTNGSKDFSQGVFCLDSEKSFPSEGTTLYKKEGEYTEKEEVKKIADNMYLPTMTETEKDAVLLKIFGDKIEAEKDLVPPTTLELIKEILTADDIFFAEQCAIWTYTNNFTWLSTGIKYTTDGSTWLDASDMPNGKLDLMKIIYDYFTEGNSKLSLETNLTDVSLTRSEKETIELTDGVAVGPFKINSGTNTNYTAKLYNQNDTEITNYTLVDKSGNSLGTSTTNVLDKEFYVKVTDSSITKVTLKIESTQTKTTKTLWKSTENTNSMQPLLLVNKEPVTSTDEDEAVIVITDNIYDLALRKYITKVGDTEITSRIPKISYDETSENKIVYLHKKDPILLNPGDNVVYTLTVYNEGEEAGKPTKIIDYLPEGLEYVTDSSINEQYGWVPSSDGTYAVTAYTSKFEDLDPFDKENMKISSISVQIECKVKETVTEGILTNIAEIAEDNIEDIDSVPNTIKTGVSDDYTGKDNKEDLTDSDYFYKGQEDDDDFEKVTVEKPEGTLDLALRKYIQTVNGKAQNREPKVDVTALKEGTSTTATYTHSKDPVEVKQGDIVIYSIRVYNEGEEDAYAHEITDYIPEGLGFILNHEINYNNGWKVDESSSGTVVKLNTINNATSNLTLSDFEDTEDLNNVDVVTGKVSIKSNKLKYTEGGNDNILKAFTSSMTEPDYKTLQVACVVVADELSDEVIKNIAAITDERNSNGEKATDRDSEAEEIDTSNYPDSTNIQDDDDFEKLVLKPNYDLALKKFITSVSGEEITPSRLQNVNTAPLLDEEEDAEYTMDKTIVKLKTGDTVVYTIRVYNEGDIDAVVGEIVDTLPEGLEYIEDSELNKTYGWEIFTDTNSEGWQTGLKTDYLSEETIKAFNKQTGEISYKEVQIELKVIGEDAVPIKNIAEITKDDGDDRDSTPNNKIDEEDDQDYDTVIPVVFDLALQKFITGLNGNQVTGRDPLLTIDEEYNISYAHTKEPLSVANNNIVTYTIRVYNEGNIDGYVAELKDDIPEGLVFIPDDEINVQYAWKMLDSDGNETDDVDEAVEIRTDYLSKENSEARGEDNLLKAFDRELGITDDNPDYRDVKVSFKVDQTKLDSLDRVIINTAEITKDTDENGNDITDKDSTPDNNNEDEDDIDKEYIELKYFDLSLVKYISTVVVNENGTVKTTQTGHDGTENPEPSVKVEIHRNKLNTTEVTFIYTIKVTNEGQLEGYATEVKDRIPEGLSFYKEDNPDWEILEDGIVVTNALADTLLQPGESAEVQIALRWNKSESNLGMKTNIAEISKDDNPYGAPDIDSTPDNNVDGEDDQDIAPVILSIKTGGTMHAVLVITIITMLGTGVYSIKKFVL